MSSSSRAPAESLVEQTLARILVSSKACPQPPLAALPPTELTVVLPALSPGGAERIVLDWATRVGGRHRIHMVLLRRAPVEYAVPEGLRLTRVGDDPPALEALARKLEVSTEPPIWLCHLLNVRQRAAIRRGGALPVPVIHNARAGWIDTPQELNREPLLIAVSRACAGELRATGFSGRILVIRHLPVLPNLDPR